MSKIYIIPEERTANSKLRKLLPSLSEGCTCLIVGDISEETSVMLAERNVHVIEQGRCDSVTRERFLNEYTDLIGTLGAEQNDLLWWATDISSKNRFMSNLPDLLWKYIGIIDIVEHEEYDNLILIGSLSELLAVLKKIFHEKNIECKVLDNILARRFRRARFVGRKVLSVIYNAFRFYFRALYARSVLGNRFHIRLRDRKERYAIKTFIYDHSFAGDGTYKDAFFGRLPQFLQNKINVVIYANILGNYRACMGKIKACQDAEIAPLEIFISFADILKGIEQVLTFRIKVPEGVHFMGANISAVLDHLLKAPFTGIQTGQFLHYKATKNFLARASVKTFLLSYENNPWEKMCMKAIRETSPGTKIIGYQHNVVPRASLNMFISQKELPVIPKPDIVLTTGEAPKTIMERYSCLTSGNIRTSCALRHEYLFHSDTAQRQPTKKKTVLLALEGIFDVYQMVNYVLDQLRDHQEYRIVLRSHPVLPVERFQYRLRYDLRALKNIEISSGMTLKEDIERSDIVIYWGSTVGMESLWMGKPVVHFDNGSILEFDPLFECSNLKWIVDKNSELLATLREIELLNEEQFNDQKKEARAYLERYFYPVTEENLESFWS